MSKEKLTNQLKNAYKQLEEEFKNKGRPNTIEDNNVDYDNCNIYAMRQKISDLEAKLAESEEEIKIVREQNGRVIEKLDLIVRSNQDLEKQLAEKEKAHMEAMENALNHFLTLRQELNQAKIDFVIEQIQKAWDMFSEEYFANEKMETLGTRFLARLDQQIKELRG